MEKIDTKVRDNTAEENYLDTIPLTEEELTKYIEDEILVINKGNLCFTRKGILLGNLVFQIFVEVL